MTQASENASTARRHEADRAMRTALKACLLSWLALSSAGSPLAAADVVKIGIARTISDVGYYIADAKGFFREEGLEVAINGFASAAQMVAPLGTGELDV